MKKITLIAAVWIGAWGLWAGAVLAQQTTPTVDKPIKMLVGFTPGGSADVIARLLAQHLSAKLGGQSVIVENKPGAAGRIAIDAVKNAAPDGTTLLVTPSGPMVIFPHVFKKLGFDPVRDFTPVSQLASFQFTVTSGPKSNVKNIAEMLAKAKSDPSTASFATPGTGTAPQFLGVMLSDTAKVELQHVPFQGGAPALNALLGGHVGYQIDVVSEILEVSRSGKVNVIAVTGAKRSAQLPDVATLREQGIAMDASAWFAIYGPANMPPAVLARLSRAVMDAVNDPVMKAKLISLGFDAIGGTPEQLAAVQKADLNKWEKPIKTTGFQAD
ncbi:MAG: tripartite tricarboxylate transporter substrate-binding protein [Cytophagales bacterium]|nr:tripartite tricarboxylate transporter substrate-binding protein [Cytophagales bacterium]